MATSYTYGAGSGNRQAVIAATSDWIASGTPQSALDGNTATSPYFWFQGGAVAGHYLQFDFGVLVLVDEARSYWDSTAANGTWKWQGSNDGSTWTDIGGSFTFGGTSPQVHSTLNGNTTPYRYLRILGVSGSSSTGPDCLEFEFKSAAGDSNPSYFNSGGMGNRSASITVTSSGITWSGSPSYLVDGANSPAPWWSGTPSAGAYLRFDFGADNSELVTEMRFTLDRATSGSGTFQAQGSNDGTAWTNIGSTFTVTASQVNGVYQFICNTLAGNATGYRFYQWLWVSGSLDGGPNYWEILFKIEPLAAVIPGVEVSKASLYAVLQTLIPGVEVSKANLYAVLVSTPPDDSRITGVRAEVAPLTPGRLTGVRAEVAAVTPYRETGVRVEVAAVTPFRMTGIRILVALPTIPVASIGGKLRNYAL